MAELLVTLDAVDNRFDAGDVIAACPDGWGWGTEELGNPKWRVLKFPGLPVDAAREMLEPVWGVKGAQETKGPLLKRRLRRFDLAKSTFDEYRAQLDSKSPNTEKISMKGIDYIDGRQIKNP